METESYLNSKFFKIALKQSLQLCKGWIMIGDKFKGKTDYRYVRVINYN